MAGMHSSQQVFRERLDVAERRLRLFAGFAAVVLLALTPLWVSGARLLFWAMVLVLVLFALTVNMLIGYTGLPTFGHAAFLGIGAYSFALMVSNDWPFILAVVAAPFISVVSGLAFSYIGLRSTGVGFAMLTLAFAQVLYLFTFKLSVVGGENGIVGLLGYQLLGLDFNLASNVWWFVLAVVAASALCLYRIARSPLGLTMKMLRDDATRAEFLGVPIRRYQRITLVVSAGFAGLAGALLVVTQSSVTPNVFHWTMSGEAIIMSVLGGTQYFLGPVVGAVVFLLFRDWLTDVTTAWTLWVGGLFLIVVLVAPRGIVGILHDTWRKVTRRRTLEARTTDPVERSGEPGAGHE